MKGKIEVSNLVSVQDKKHQDRFNLKPLTDRDKNTNSLGQSVNLKQQPLAPFLIKGAAGLSAH